MADDLAKIHAAIGAQKNSEHAAVDTRGFALPDEARIRAAISTAPQVKDEAPAKEYLAPSANIEK